MLNARRAEPIPTDFEYALARYDLPISSITPHLKPPIHPSKTRLHLELSPPEEEKAEKQINLARLLGAELSGKSEKRDRAYVPQKFIDFPSQHTYKWTEKEFSRETDPRKIREEAAKAARHAEEALRRLVKVSKAGKEKDVKLAASRDPRTKERHELWEKTMEELMAGKDNTLIDDEDQSMIVNSESEYFRKGVPRKSRTVMALGRQTDRELMNP
jgi:transcription initiation factor TFIID subunit 8